MVTLFHVTLWRRHKGIRAKGLLRSKSRGARKVVWMCEESNIRWAILHTQKRHRASLHTVVVLPVQVNPERVRLHGNGLYYHLDDVPPANIGTAHLAEEWA